VSRSLRPLLCGAAVGAGALLAIVASAASVRVRTNRDRLWVEARDATAAEVFSAIAARTGVKFVVDKELKPGPITIEIQGLDFERAIDNLVKQIPSAAGHSVSYSREGDGDSHPTLVMIYGGGKASGPATADIYASQPTPGPIPTPDLEERREKMIEAGVPPATADKVIELTREVQQLQATPIPGTYSPDDLGPESREQLQTLLDRGVPMERAVQMLLLQERYQETLKELSRASGSSGRFDVPVAPQAPASEPPAEEAPPLEAPVEEAPPPEVPAEEAAPPEDPAAEPE
jgi:hypothetical protein